MTLAYLDSSAIVKLIVPEAESSALVAWLEPYRDVVTSDLSLVEVPRAVERTGQDPALELTDDVLARFVTINLDRHVIRIARQLQPGVVRTLDAIHVASALSLGGAEVTFVAYDHRSLDTAAMAELASASPA